MFHFVRKEVIDMADSKVEYPTPDCLAPAAIEAKTEAAGAGKPLYRLKPIKHSPLASRGITWENI